jgi:Fe2+ or Zn2+ uptake regulation protein
MVEIERAIIESLQKMDLSYEEAQIYFTLLKYGKSGTVVRKIREELPDIERTTIYSILKRLNEKGCVESNDSKKIKTFIAIDPSEYFNKIFLLKKKEFEELQEIENDMLSNLQNIYESGLELSYEELDPFILPYIQPLLNDDWKIKAQKINKGVNVFGGDIYYEYYIYPPNNLKEKVPMIGLVISIYDSEIDTDNITLLFFLKQIKKIIIELHQEDFDDIEIVDRKIDLLGKRIISLDIRAREKKSKILHNFGSTALLPVKNKIFFLWEEIRHDERIIDKKEQITILEKIVKPFLEAEGVPYG